VQVADEIRGVLDLVEEVLSTFGFTKYEVNLSTRPEKSVGGSQQLQIPYKCRFLPRSGVDLIPLRWLQATRPSGRLLRMLWSSPWAARAGATRWTRAAALSTAPRSTSRSRHVLSDV